MILRRFQRIDPARGMARFYELSVVPTLFGDYAQVRRWGRIGAPPCQRETWYATQAEAEAHAAQQAKRKLARGYIEIA